MIWLVCLIEIEEGFWLNSFVLCELSLLLLRVSTCLILAFWGHLFGCDHKLGLLFAFARSLYVNMVERSEVPCLVIGSAGGLKDFRLDRSCIFSFCPASSYSVLLLVNINYHYYHRMSFSKSYQHSGILAHKTSYIWSFLVHSSCTRYHHSKQFNIQASCHHRAHQIFFRHGV